MNIQFLGYVAPVLEPHLGFLYLRVGEFVFRLHGVESNSPIRVDFHSVAEALQDAQAHARLLEDWVFYRYLSVSPFTKQALEAIVQATQKLEINRRLTA